MFKVIIAGGRDFNDYALLETKMNKILSNIDTDVQIVSGTANGADTVGESYANNNKLSIKQFPAQWDTHGKRAGYIRNEQMAIYADACVCFWDGKSRGTKHMIDLATKHNIKLRVVRY